MLDDEYQHLGQVTDDYNAQPNCVYANGPMGNNSAAVIAMQMKSAFPSIQFGFMAGTGGGVRSEKGEHTARR
jgi:hypothetical protein